jgi:hypothetical protein
MDRWRKLRARLFVLLAIVIVLIPGPLSSFERSIGPSMTSVEESPIEGDVGSVTLYNYVEPVRELALFNGTILSSDAEWHTTSDGMNVTMENPTSAIVELTGSDTSQSDISQYAPFYAIFFGLLPFPVMNYSSIHFILEAEVLEGVVEVGFSTGFSGYPRIDPWFEIDTRETTLSAGEGVTFVEVGTVRGIEEHMSDWMVRSFLNVHLSSDAESKTRIKGLAIRVESTEDLYPVVFDLQAPDGNSLFSNPYLNWMGGFWRYSGFAILGNDEYYSPSYQLERDGFNETGGFDPFEANRTLYLGEGTYTGQAGWWNTRDDYIGLSAVNVSFVVSENETAEVYTRIPTFRLYIDVTPAFAYTIVGAYTDLGLEVRNDYHYLVDLPLHGEVEYLYMPPLTELRVFFIPMYGSRSYQEYGIDIEKASLSCIRVTAAYQRTQFMNLSFDFSQLLFTSILAMLFMVAVANAIVQIRQEDSIRNHKALPFVASVLTLLVFILPLASYSFSTGAYPPNEIQALIFPGLLAAMWWSDNSPLTPTPSSYLMPSLFSYILFCLLPITWILWKLVVDRTAPNFIESVFVSNVPLLFALTILVPVYQGLCLPSIGFYLAAFTIMVWIAYLILRKSSH